MRHIPFALFSFWLVASFVFGGRPEPLDYLLAAGALSSVGVSFYAVTGWYERRLARKRAVLDEALATLQESDGSSQSAGASAQD